MEASISCSVVVGKYNNSNESGERYLRVISTIPIYSISCYFVPGSKLADFRIQIKLQNCLFLL